MRGRAGAEVVVSRTTGRGKRENHSEGTTMRAEVVVGRMIGSREAKR
jgi:hypothetical protein